MFQYNDQFIFVNERPVGYSKDVDTKELERNGFVKITGPFNEKAKGQTAPATPAKAAPASAPTPPPNIPSPR